MLQFTYLEDSRVRYEMLLQEAEEARMANRVLHARQEKQGASLLVHVGNWLIDAGSWMKKRAQLEVGVR